MVEDNIRHIGIKNNLLTTPRLILEKLLENADEYEQIVAIVLYKERGEDDSKITESTWSAGCRLTKMGMTAQLLTDFSKD